MEIHLKRAALIASDWEEKQNCNRAGSGLIYAKILQNFSFTLWLLERFHTHQVAVNSSGMAPTIITKAAESRKRKRDDGKAKEIANSVNSKLSSETSVFKQKTLILSSRGVSYRQRHLMDDITALLPHSKKGV